MRAFLQPSVRTLCSETQIEFTKLSRARRSKIAELANTTLFKADQWAHGGGVPAAVATALETGLKSIQKKK